MEKKAKELTRSDLLTLLEILVCREGGSILISRRDTEKVPERVRLFVIDDANSIRIVTRE